LNKQLKNVRTIVHIFDHQSWQQQPIVASIITKYTVLSDHKKGNTNCMVIISCPNCNMYRIVFQLIMKCVCVGSLAQKPTFHVLELQ
jgi:hypothetical protein